MTGWNTYWAAQQADIACRDAKAVSDDIVTVLAAHIEAAGATEDPEYALVAVDDLRRALDEITALRGAEK